MIRNILSSNGKSLNVPVIPPQYGEELSSLSRFWTVDYRTTPRESLIYSNKVTVNRIVWQILKIKTMVSIPTNYPFHGLASSRLEKSGDPMLKVLAFYESLIDALASENADRFEPIVSLSHFDFRFICMKNTEHGKVGKWLCMKKYCSCFNPLLKKSHLDWITFLKKWKRSVLFAIPCALATLDSTENQESNKFCRLPTIS